MYKLGLPTIDAEKEDNVFIDIEMFGQDIAKLHRPHGKFASMQIGLRDGVYIITDPHDINEALRRVKSARYWVGHNLKYDITQLRGLGATITDRPLWDTMLVERNLWNGYYSEFALADLVRRYLGIHMDKTTREEFATRTEMTPKMLDYAADDIIYTQKVFDAQNLCGVMQKRDLSGYWNYDEPALWAIMDFLPSKVDVAGWDEMVRGFDKEAKRLEEELGINVKSPQQKKDFVYRMTGKVIKDSRAETINAISHPIIEKLLDATTYRDAVSKYGFDWIEKHVEKGDLVYGDYWDIGTETFRLACSSPNMQNIPSRKIPEYRERFISNEGELVVSDISQQEPRVLAHLSKDKELLGIFQRGEDIHLLVARAAYGDDTILKGDERRSAGKVINLASSYGMTAVGLSQKLRITEDEAQKFLDGYFRKFPDVKLWIGRQHLYAKRMEYVETLGGHRIWINPYNHSADNNSVNDPIQGTSGEIMKGWMIGLRERCKAKGMKYPVAMSVHDELVLDTSKEDTAIYIEMLKDALAETADRLCPGIPFPAEVFVGSNWACKK
jgi:DNA polymerase I